MNCVSAPEQYKNLDMSCKMDLDLLQRSRQEGVFDDNFSSFSSKPYVMTPHQNHLSETVQMRGHNICFYAEVTKIIPNYHQILALN